ncbi:MAG TPA: hypothetical protein VFA42_06095 [Gaiellaceae bacterium]|jgi:hypothetical protein|nr:hypothetical protein [Gaiellaceae bacterium]
MRAIVGLLGGVLIVLMLAEFFVAFLLPRRVKRDPRIARGTVEVIWKPWRAIARRLPPIPADAMLGYFGPLAFLLELAVWVLGLVVGYACLQWAGGGRFSLDSSAGTFLAATFDHTGSWHRAVGFVETATAVGVLFTVIGYLPAVYSAYSLREIAISRLSTRAGAPASAAGLLAHGRSELVETLTEAERWATEMMETHLAYPLLAYYRSQHVSQNWLSALTAIVDTSAVILAAVDGDEFEPRRADLAFRVGRHALADLGHQLADGRNGPVREISDDDVAWLRGLLEGTGLPLVPVGTCRERLSRLRAEYEENASALSAQLALKLPPWRPDEQTLARPALAPAYRR